MPNLYSPFYQYLVYNSGCACILKSCELSNDDGQLIIDCPDIETILALNGHTNKIAAIISAISNDFFEMVIMLKGEEYDAIPLYNSVYDKDNTMLTSTSPTIANYPELLDLVRYSPYATYVSIVPPAWEWEKPIRCVLASDGIREFSKKSPLDFAGADLTLLYDKVDMEEQIGILMREFDRNGCRPTKISDLTYFTYLSDPTRKSIHKDPSQKYQYNADFEMQYIDGIGLVRICHCKERVLVARL